MTFSNRGGLKNHLRVHRIPRQRIHQPQSRTPVPEQHVANDNNHPSPIPVGFEHDEHEGELMDITDDGTSRKRGERVRYHPLINGTPFFSVAFCCISFIVVSAGLPCDSQGNFLPEGALPPPWDRPPTDDFSPFKNRAEFELADLLFRKDQMSASSINELLQIWAATLPEDQDPPFVNQKHLYDTIDAIDVGDTPWNSFSVSFNGEIPEGDKTPWKHAQYDVWYRDPRVVLHNQLANMDFVTEIDFAAKEVTDENDTRRYTDFMSGNWAWRHSVCLFITI
jgi:hypothetical protein